MQEDDLAGLFQPAPPGATQPMGYRQGHVRNWNPATLENEVVVGGTVLQNVPVLGVAEAASLTNGATVGLMVVGSTWAIIGRLVTPGTEEARDAITQVSQGVVSASVPTLQSTTSTSYTDLTTPGPAVPLNVRASGKVLIMVTAGFNCLPSSTTLVSCVMSYDITGATTRPPVAGTTPSAFLQFKESAASECDGRFTAIALEEGLTPGLTMFTAKYRSGNGQTAAFSGRNITVFAL